MQMSKRDALDLVYKSEDHAADLLRLADSLNSSLSDVRNTSLNATNAIQAHSSIKNMIEQAEILAEQSSYTISNTLGLVSRPNGSIDVTSKNSMIFSSQLLNESKNLSRNTEGLVSHLNGLKTKVDEIQKRTYVFTGQINEQLRSLRTLPNDTSSKLQEAKDLALSASSTAAGTLGHIMNFSHKLTNA
ncbi:unnamed protein product, partial [Staurois parvus]